MSKCVTLKKSNKAGPVKAGPVKAGDFGFQDNEDGTATVFGLDAAGARSSIDGLATLAVASSDPAFMTVDAPAGVTFGYHGVLPGVSTVTMTATWNDGSVGPFTIDVKATVSAGPAKSLDVDWGTPVMRP